MNSIATMTKAAPPVPTRYSLALNAAIIGSGITKAAIASHMNVSPGMVSQWANGLRPVPAEKAQRLGDYLSVDPAKISAKFAEHWDTASNVVPLRQRAGEEPLRQDLQIARLENDIDSLRFAVAALVSAMTVHRPAEATDVAKTIRKNVPQKFVRRGYLHELLQALDKG